MLLPTMNSKPILQFRSRQVLDNKHEYTPTCIAGIINTQVQAVQVKWKIQNWDVLNGKCLPWKDLYDDQEDKYNVSFSKAILLFYSSIFASMYQYNRQYTISSRDSLIFLNNGTSISHKNVFTPHIPHTTVFSWFIFVLHIRLFVTW